tara:strand:+ start:1004 stop:1348 length:345 start_codon:yes stop_codon:yes gene_type:complete
MSDSSPSLYEAVSILRGSVSFTYIDDILQKQDTGYEHHLATSITKQEKQETDSYVIRWDDVLSTEDQRILKKILLKSYADAGRKRGAILRYIKHFKTEPDITGNKLYGICQNKN